LLFCQQTQKLVVGGVQTIQKVIVETRIHLAHELKKNKKKTWSKRKKEQQRKKTNLKKPQQNSNPEKQAVWDISKIKISQNQYKPRSRLDVP